MSLIEKDAEYYRAKMELRRRTPADVDRERVARYIARGFIDLKRAYDPTYRAFLAREWQWNRGRFEQALDYHLELDRWRQRHPEAAEPKKRRTA